MRTRASAAEKLQPAEGMSCLELFQVTAAVVNIAGVSGCVMEHLVSMLYLVVASEEGCEAGKGLEKF